MTTLKHTCKKYNDLKVVRGLGLFGSVVSEHLWRFFDLWCGGALGVEVSAVYGLALRLVWSFVVLSPCVC